MIRSRRRSIFGAVRLAALGVAVLGAALVSAPPAGAQSSDEGPPAAAGLSASPPVDLVGVATDRTVRVSWEVPAQPAGVYVGEMYLEWATGEGEFDHSDWIESDLDSTVVSAWTGTVRGLSAGTGYRFRVRLETTAGDVSSAELTVTTESESPAAPTGLSATATHDAVSLSWTVPEQPAWLAGTASLFVMRARNGWRAKQVGEVTWRRGVTGYSFSDGDVSPGLAYEYHIEATMGERRHRSEKVSVTTAPLPADPDGSREGATVLDLEADSGGSGFARYRDSLHRRAGDAVDYYVFTTTARYELTFEVWLTRGEYDVRAERGVSLEDAGGDPMIVSAPAGENPARRTLEPGTYYLRVEAMEDGPDGYHLYLGLVPAPPGAPAGLSAGASSWTAVALSWDAVPGAARYRVEYRSDTETDWTTASDTVGGTSHTAPDLACGTSYHFRVSAYGNGATHVADWGDASEEATRDTTDCDIAVLFDSASYLFSIAEDAAIGVEVGRVSATGANGDTLTFTIEAGNSGRFAIDASGAITVAAALDHETTPTYALAVIADDGNGGTAGTAVDVTVTDVAENEPPEFAGASHLFSVAEDAASGVEVGRVSATDPNGDTLTITIEAGNGDGRFAIDATGAITVAAALDHETTPAYTLVIQADDGDGGTARTAVDVAVTDVAENDAPEFDSASYVFSVAEDAASGVEMGRVSATDPDADALIYSIEAGNGDRRFAIDGATGAITVRAALDYEKASVYALAVRADDGNGGTARTAVLIGLIERPAAPDTPAAPVIRALHTGIFEIDWDDVDDAQHYEVRFWKPSGSYVELPGAGITIAFDGSRAVARNLSPDMTFYAFEVRATNTGGASGWSQYGILYNGNWDFTGVPVPDPIDPVAEPEANNAPAFHRSAYEFSVLEDAAVGFAVGDVSASDADGDTLTYTIEAGNRGGGFAIDGATGAITVAAALDRGRSATDALAVQADDGNGATAATAVVISLIGRPGRPTGLDVQAAVQGGTLSAAWSAPTDTGGTPITGYEVQWKQATATDWDTATVTALTHEISNLTNGIAHQVRVAAVNAIGTGPHTSPATATPARAPGPPTGLSAQIEPGRGNKLQVQWSPPSDAGQDPVTAYLLQWRRIGQIAWTATTVTSPPHLISGLTNDQDYAIRVAATSAAGTGAFSDPIVATPRSGTHQLREFIAELIEAHGEDYPWLQTTWDYLDDRNRLPVACEDCGYVSELLTANFNSNFPPPSAPTRPLRVPGIDILYVSPAAVHHAGLVTRALAYAYTLTDAPENPEPIAVVMLYLHKHVEPRARALCKPAELFAGALETLVATSDINYWTRDQCQKTVSITLADAQAVVRTALGGETPAWFADTYTVDGELDLEALWSDVKRVTRTFDRWAVAYQLRDSFGGYCSETQVGEALESETPQDEKDALRNPWRDGGCLPGAPRNLRATADQLDITVTWEAPDTDGGRTIAGYTVQWKGPDDAGYDPSRQQDVPASATLSTSFRPGGRGITYHVRVVARNGLDDGDDSTANDDWGPPAEITAMLPERS